MIPTWPTLFPAQRFSLIRLVANLIGLPLVLIAIRDLHIVWASFLVGSYVVFAVLFYPKALRRLSKPMLWIQFVGVTLLAAFLLGGLTQKDPGWTSRGLVIGLQMTIRAVYMVTAFQIMSVELRNPKIVDWFLRRGMGQLSLAMETAFSALPTMAAALGDQKNALRHPLSSLSRVWFFVQSELSRHGLFPRNIFILTGASGSGKTTTLQTLVKNAPKRGLQIGGILAPVCWMDSKRVGYDVIDVKNGSRERLCRTDGTDKERIGPFHFSREGLTFGTRALDPISMTDCDAVIVDEVGPLELEGRGWAPALDTLLTSSNLNLLLVVREPLIDPVKKKWDFTPARIWKVGTDPFPFLADQITDALLGNRGERGQLRFPQLGSIGGSARCDKPARST